LRVPDADVGTVRSVLDAGGVQAEVTVVPASLEERFVELAA
jgi:hypothetical protein